MICQTENRAHVDSNHLKWLLVIVNGRQSGWEAVLRDNSTIAFLRGALGG